MRNKHSLLAILAVLAIAASACGDSTEVGPGAASASLASALDGRQFWSTSVTQDGEPRALVDGTRISLRFDGGSVGATAGCNSVGGDFSLGSDGVLVVSGLSTTEIGCDQPRHDQDNLVSNALTSSPTLSLDGDVLTLETPVLTIEFLDRELADPDLPIIGTQWTITGFVQGDVAMAIAVDVPGTVSFSNDSTMAVSDGCTDRIISVEISDGSIGGPVEGDGEIQFGSTQTESDRSSQCDDLGDYVDAVNQAFASGGATYSIDGPLLTLVGRDGDGLTLRASD